MFWRNEQGILWMQCFFLHTAERLDNRRKEPIRKISAWIKARLNFSLIQSMLPCLWGAKTPSNVYNTSKINLCAIVPESNIEWITYRFIPYYFTIINMYGYLFLWSFLRYLYPVIRWYGTYIDYIFSISSYKKLGITTSVSIFSSKNFSWFNFKKNI